jgi:hypothetical protein
VRAEVANGVDTELLARDPTQAGESCAAPIVTVEPATASGRTRAWNPNAIVASAGRGEASCHEITETQVRMRRRRWKSGGDTGRRATSVSAASSVTVNSTAGSATRSDSSR